MLSQIVADIGSHIPPQGGDVSTAAAVRPEFIQEHNHQCDPKTIEFMPKNLQLP
ncbi:hypothetical protein RhiirA4_492160 [Rhizophagus irregularis]|uniref:Uncharacterized protein n=1 Tax=Rhizophagus irregularis TaxID=588596 RepID=A0A2I1HWX6_9GLOM|nr:hypothetical protein RhiirA4_492160 [Rhizophagus irregularis]